MTKKNKKKVSIQQFQVLVEKAGGSKAAAKIMGVTTGSVSNHIRGGSTISLARVRKLQKAVDPDYAAKMTGEKVAHPDTIFLSPAELEKVKGLRWFEHEDGYQRPVNENRVAQIEDGLRKGNAKLPPIVLGRLPDDTLVEIDGQHRRFGHIAAGVPCQAVVFDVKDTEECRHLFLQYGGKVVPISSKDRYKASRNPLKMLLANWEVEFNADVKHVCALARGLIGRSHVDFVDPDSVMPKAQVWRGRTILQVWTKDSLWDSSRKRASTKKKPRAKNPSIYSSPKMLQALGVLSQDFGKTDDLIKALNIIVAYKKSTVRPGSFYRCAVEGSYRDLVDALRAYVVPRLLGGETKRKRQPKGVAV
jgi:hypothetical protein